MPASIGWPWISRGLVVAEVCRRFERDLAFAPGLEAEVGLLRFGLEHRVVPGIGRVLVRERGIDAGDGRRIGQRDRARLQAPPLVVDRDIGIAERFPEPAAALATDGSHEDLAVVDDDPDDRGMDLARWRVGLDPDLAGDI